MEDNISSILRCWWHRIIEI